MWDFGRHHIAPFPIFIRKNKTVCNFDQFTFSCNILSGNNYRVVIFYKRNKLEETDCLSQDNNFYVYVVKMYYNDSVCKEYCTQTSQILE